MSNKEIKILSKNEVQQNPFYDEEKASRGDVLCYSQPLVKIEFSYDNKKYILVYDDISYSDLESRWSVCIMVEGVKINKMLFFYECDFIEDTIEYIKFNDYFKKELYRKFLSNEELWKYFPQESIEDIKERIDNNRTKTKIRRIKRDRENKLENYLKEKDETLNLCDVVFRENNKISLHFYKDAIPLLSMVEICLDLEDYFGYKHVREMTMKYLIGSVVDYIKDIIELLHSNDPKILGKYYNDIETITGLEDGLTKTLS